MHLTESEEKMDKKITGVFGYITWIGWLIAYLLGDKEGAKFHLNQGAVLALAEIIVSAAALAVGVTLYPSPSRRTSSDVAIASTSGII